LYSTKAPCTYVHSIAIVNATRWIRSHHPFWFHAFNSITHQAQAGQQAWALTELAPRPSPVCTLHGESRHQQPPMPEHMSSRQDPIPFWSTIAAADPIPHSASPQTFFRRLRRGIARNGSAAFSGRVRSTPILPLFTDDQTSVGQRPGSVRWRYAMECL
jgi:hypothetical protein